jgi:hypothetical protein
MGDFCLGISVVPPIVLAHTNSGSNRGTAAWLVGGVYSDISLTILRLLLQVMMMNARHCDHGIKCKGSLVFWRYVLCLFVD